MYRSVAAILALTFSYLLTLPVLAVSRESNLPACCRRDGKHHCAMTQAEAQQGASVTAKCSFFPHVAIAAHLDKFAAAGRLTAFTSSVTRPACCRQTAAGYRLSSHQSERKRGPPPSILIS